MFIRQLKYLVALDQEKHFGRAASKCHVSQPGLSGAIRSIENELGLVIVQRGRRFQGFTSDGERVLAWARRVLADCDSLRQEASAASGGPSGVLRIGVIPAVVPLVTPFLQYCLKHYPGITHRLHTLSATEILRKLVNFELDVGITYLDAESLEAFEKRSLCRETYVLVCGPHESMEGKQSVSWRHAAELPLVLFTDNMQCRTGIDRAFAAAGASPKPVVEADSITAILALVASAGLYSVLPNSVASMEHAIGQFRFLPMLPENHRDIGLVLVKQRHQSPLLQVALNAMSESISGSTPLERRP